MQQHLNMPQTCHSQNQREVHNRDKEKLTIETKRKQKKIRTRKAFNAWKKKWGKKLDPKNRSFCKKKVGKDSSDKGVKWKRWHKGEKGQLNNGVGVCC